MGDNPLPENEEHEYREDAEEVLIPHQEQNDVAPEGAQAAEPRPGQLLNVREVILPPLPPVNGLIIPNGPGNHQELLLNLEEHLGRYANLADLIARNNDPIINMGDIRDLLDAIDLVDEEEDEERRLNPGDGAPAEEKHDDSEDSEGEEPAPPAVGPVDHAEKN